MRDPLVQAHELVVSVIGRIVRVLARREGIIALDEAPDCLRQLIGGRRKKRVRFETRRLAPDFQRNVDIAETVAVSRILGFAKRWPGVLEPQLGQLSVLH